MLDIETYKKISSGKLSSFLFIIPKKNHSFTAQYVAKDKQDASACFDLLRQMYFLRKGYDPTQSTI